MAVTTFQAFRLKPSLCYKNLKVLEETILIYEKNLAKSFDGSEWQKEPMLQLAFLYEVSNNKDKAAEVYMRALDYVDGMNEEFIVTYKFDYLSRSNKEKLLDSIEAGDFNREDFEELMGENADDMTEDDKKKIEDAISDAQAQLENATTEEEREIVLEKLKADFIKKQKSGDLPGSKKLKEKLAKEGKTMEEYMKEQGL